MSDDDDDDDSTVTITSSSSIGRFIGGGGGATGPSMASLTIGGGGGGGGVGVGAQGHTGTTGSYYVSTGTGVGTMWSTPTLNPSVLSTSKGNSVDLDELAEMMKIMKERLLILIPDFEKHEKYAALKKAYDNYKMIEALIQEDRKDDK